MTAFKDLLVQEEEYTQQAQKIAAGQDVLTVAKLDEFHKLTTKIVKIRRELVRHPNYHPNASHAEH